MMIYSFELLNRQSIVNYYFIKYISYFLIILMYDDLQIIHAEVAKNDSGDCKDVIDAE
jgi:hypothetical protein